MREIIIIIIIINAWRYTSDTPTCLHGLHRKILLCLCPVIAWREWGKQKCLSQGNRWPAPDFKVRSQNTRILDSLEVFLVTVLTIYATIAGELWSLLHDSKSTRLENDICNSNKMGKEGVSAKCCVKYRKWRCSAKKNEKSNAVEVGSPIC
jgi:hypothetical protein